MKHFRVLLLLLILMQPILTWAQPDLQKPFRDCHLQGSITLYDMQQKKWLFSDEANSQMKTLPASTFKIINSLIALETGVIRDENEIVPWVGKIDTVLYGYRPEIYHDMPMKEAFRESAGWVYIELAKKIGKERYQQYLKQCHYGNGNLSHPYADFWNFGAFGISPRNQVEFLKAFYEEKLPFSKRNFQLVKAMLVAETGDNYTIRAKTGWTRDGGKDTGWWVGYVERNNQVILFATRVIKDLKIPNPDFGPCRKEITRAVLRQLEVIE